jgi:DNA-binding NarL/FixJ family response regulator
MFPLRVIVVDDHKLFRQGLVSLMKTRSDLVQVVGEASSGREAVALTRHLQPDVVLMDIYMPDGDGIQAASIICHEMPDVSIIMLTSSDEDRHLFEAMQLGAVGYLLKDLDAAELFDLISGVPRGECAITRAMAARLLKGMARGGEANAGLPEPLSEREIEVLQLVAQGYSNPQIAEELCISINTVKSHIKNILGKLQLENRTQVATYAVQTGLVSGLG